MIVCDNCAKALSRMTRPFVVTVAFGGATPMSIDSSPLHFCEACVGIARTSIANVLLHLSNEGGRSGRPPVTAITTIGEVDAYDDTGEPPVPDAPAPARPPCQPDPNCCARTKPVSHACDRCPNPAAATPATTPDPAAPAPPHPAP